MDNTRAQQKALDDELVAPADRLKIRKSNLRLRSSLKSKEFWSLSRGSSSSTPFQVEWNSPPLTLDNFRGYAQDFP
ncbi:hypothetical protein Tco_0417560 [Tanacetum coccineum]